MVPYSRSQSRLLKSAGSRSGVRWADVWYTVRYILQCLVHSLFKLWDLNPVSLVLRRWRQLHHMNTMMTLSIRPRLIDLATDFFLSDDRRKRKLLSWVKSILPWVGEDVIDFTACWQDGIVLCSLIEAINPGACPRFGQLKPHHRVPNCRLGLQLATQYLQVTQLPLCPEEMAIADSRTEVKICHLVQLLKWKFQKQGSKPTVFSILTVDEPLPCKCQARGTGIRAAIVGRRAKFNILAETSTRLDLEIEIRGPNNEYNKEKIVSVDTGTALPYRSNQYLTTTSLPVSEDDGRSKIIDDGAGHSFLRQKSTEEDNTGHVVIPFDYQCVGVGRFLVTYIPRTAGLHYITVLSGGVRIPGSPFEVKVSDWISSWNLMPKSRAGPIDMLHSGQEKLAETSPVSKDANTKIKRQISQVAHMSQQLTRMKRRIRRKVITPNGEEIICEVVPALTRQKSQDLLLIEEDRHQPEVAEQTDKETGLPSVKYLQNEAISDYHKDVCDNIHARTEEIPGDQIDSRIMEQQHVKNKLTTPTVVVTLDDQCDESDAWDVNVGRAIDFSVLVHTTDDFKDNREPDSFEQVFLSKEKTVFPSPTYGFPKASSPLGSIQSGLDGATITTGLKRTGSYSPKPSHSLPTRVSDASRSTESEGALTILRDADIPGRVLQKLGAHKRKSTSPVNSHKIRSLSADAAFLQRGSDFGNHNIQPVAVEVLISTTSPEEILYSSSVGENDKTWCQKNNIPCTNIDALCSPSVNHGVPLPGFSLLQISPSKEECGESGSFEISRHDQIYNSWMVDSGNPTDTGLWSSLQGNTDHSVEMNNSGLHPGGNIINKINDSRESHPDNRQCRIVGKVADIASLEHKTYTNETVHDQDFANPREDDVNKHVSSDASWTSNVSSWVKTQNWTALPMSSSLDADIFKCDADIKVPLYKSENAGSMLKKSLSDPQRAGNFEGKPRREVSPREAWADSTVNLDKPELEMFFARSTACPKSETSYKELDRNQYKIEILNSSGFSRPYFCFKDSAQNDQTKIQVPTESKLLSDGRNEVTREPWVKNGRGDDIIFMNASSGDGCVKSDKRSVSDIDRMSSFDGRVALSHSDEANVEEMYSDDDEILHIVIEPKRNNSYNKNDTSNDEYTTRDIQTNDNLPVLEKPNKCLAVLVDTSQVLYDDTGEQLTRQQMEEINRVSPFSDLSKISGNSDWSDNEDAARRFSESQKSKFTTGRYFLKGDWSPQFVELNYQGGMRSRRRSSTRSANSLSPSNCSHRTKRSITSLLDGGHTDFDRISSSLDIGRRASDHNKDKDDNESPVKVHSRGISPRKKSMQTSDTDLHKKMDNGHKATSKHCVTNNNKSNTNLETTGNDGRRLYLRRRRKPVYIHENPSETQTGKDDLTDNVKSQYTQDIDDIKPRPQQNDTAETFLTNMDLLWPDVSQCLPIDNWSSLNNSWLSDLYAYSRCFSEDYGQWLDGSNPSRDPHQMPWCISETFKERTLTPTKYRKKKRRQHQWRGIDDHEACFTGSGSNQAVLTYGDRFLTPTKYRRQKEATAKSRDKPQMKVHCQRDSNISDILTGRPDSEEARRFSYGNRHTRTEKQGPAFSQCTTHIVDSMLNVKQPNSCQDCGVSQIPVIHTHDNRVHKYSEMRRSMRNNCSTEKAHREELHEAFDGQPCSCGLCLEHLNQSNEVIKTRSHIAETNKTIETTKRNIKRIDIVLKPEITNNHHDSAFRFCDSEALHFSSETSMGTDLLTTQLGHRENPEHNVLFFGVTSLEGSFHRPHSGHHNKARQDSLKSSQNLEKYPSQPHGQHQKNPGQHALFFGETSLEGCLHRSQHRGHQKNPGQDSLYPSETSLENHLLLPLPRKRHKKNPKQDPLSETSQRSSLHAPHDEHQNNPRQVFQMSMETKLENDLLQPQLGQQKNSRPDSLLSRDMCDTQHLPQSQIPCRDRECLMPHHDDDDVDDDHHHRYQQHPQLTSESSHLSPTAIQQLSPALSRVGNKFEDHLLEEGSQDHHGLLEKQQGHIPEWQEQLNERTAGYTKDRHRFGMRRQSTVETMDSGITEGSSVYSSQLSYPETADNCHLPGVDDEDFQMRLFLAMS